MAKSKRTMFSIDPRYMSENAKHRGLEITHALSEFIDNSIDAGAKTIYISKEKQENGLYTLIIEDDGKGIHQDEIKNCFSVLGYRRQYSKKSTSAFGVGSKEAMSFLTIGGVCQVVSVHEGVKSTIDISFDPKDMGLGEVKSVKTDSKNGTSIIIPHVEMTDKDHKNIINWISFIYYPAKEQDKDFNVIFRYKLKTKDEITEVPFTDVMYRNLVTYDESAVELHFDKEFPIGSDVVKVKAFVFKTDEFLKNDLFSNFDRGQKDKGSFTFEKAGVYWRLGSRYSNLGKGNFISMTNQHTLNNVRIEIDISGPKLMKSFKVNQNKSKITIPKDIENHAQLQKFFDELRLIVRGLVSNVKTGKKNLTEDEKTDKEILNDFANECGDFTGLVQKLDENKKRLDQGDPEDREEIEPSGIKRNRKKGYKQNRDAYRIEYLSISPWAPFMDVPKMYSNKYIYTINIAHPYYEIFNELSNESKKQVVMMMMNTLSTLLHIDNEDEDLEFTNKFIGRSDSILKSWVEGLSMKEKVSDIDLNLD